VKLHSPAFSRAVRERLRSEYRAFPALRKASRRQRGRRISSGWVTGVFWRLLVASFAVRVLLLVQDGGYPAVARAAVVSAWFLAVAVSGTLAVRSQALDLPAALLYLPLSAGDFERLSRRRVLGLAWRPCFDALILFTVLAACEARGPLAWLAVPPLAALCGAAVWSASVWLARFSLPPAVFLLGNLFPAALLLGAWVRALREGVFTLLSQWAVPLTLLSPGGWLAAAFFGGEGVLPRAGLAGLAPALLLAASGLLALSALTRRLQPGRALPASWESQLGHSSEEEGGEGETLPAGPSTRLADVSAAWGEPEFDAAGGGLGERLFWRWLDGRERLVLANIASSAPRWTRQLWRAARCLAAGVAIAWLRRWAPPAFAGVLGWAEGLALGLGLLIGLPVASGFDQMASATGAYGQQVARAALYPLRPPEFVRLTLKAALVRGALMLPVAVTAAAALAVPWGLPAERLAAGGAKLVFLGVAFSPCLCVFALSGVSNDTEAGFGRTGCLVGLLLVGGLLVLLALAAAALFATWAWSLAAIFSFTALAWGLSGAYLRLYERGGFDLVCAVRE